MDKQKQITNKILSMESSNNALHLLNDVFDNFEGNTKAILVSMIIASCEEVGYRKGFKKSEIRSVEIMKEFVEKITTNEEN